MKTTYLSFLLACVLHAEAQLAARQRGGGGGGSGEACVWEGHCLGKYTLFFFTLQRLTKAGDECESELDCDGDLYCRSGKCANPPGTSSSGGGGPGTIIRTTTIYVYPTPTVRPTSPAQPSCDRCEDENDCDGDLICRAGRCNLLSGGIITSTRRFTVTSPPVVTRITSTRRVTVTVPPVITRRTSTSTRRITVPPIVTTVTRSRSTLVPPRPTATSRPRPNCGDDPLSCIGLSCQEDSDCGFDLIICKNGFCDL
ncbi:hypothetical protein B0T21DRAFT_415881 [Apiosordaria backusii]|uniref:Uncharacterized protein n=1 Tax=Apiosordaria backusii TaxID=314023 RepID=A0AA40DT31_9PEZI|nr:hypothetical protein B0T21DRAFT_415881 [Apiosordaria backusii]